LPTDAVKSLVLRIYLTLVAVLLAFAALGGWLVHRQIDAERAVARAQIAERASAWAEMAQAALPAADAPEPEQAAALEDLSRRLRLALALEASDGRRLAASSSFLRRARDLDERAVGSGLGADAAAAWRERVTTRLALHDGRTLIVWRGGFWRHGGLGATGVQPDGERGPGLGMGPGMGHGMGSGAGGLSAPRPPAADGSGLPGWLRSLPGPAQSLVVLLAVLFVAVAAAAWPVARRLTRRLETLQRGVEAFGDGVLGHRVAVEGRDEVSALARSFNRAADRIEALVGANHRLLANVSHEIRSPLARLKMAVALLEGPAADAARVPPDPSRQKLITEVHANIAELDALVDEVLLASRLQARDTAPAADDPVVDLAVLAADEADGARGDAGREGLEGWRLDGPIGTEGPAPVRGDERLLRRAVRNLLQNARRYGGDRATLAVRREGAQWVLTVTDAGPGVPAAERERIFEPFHRLPGHAEHQGAVGLGLSLVRQIAERHGGRATCDAAPGGGSVFSLRLPAAG
jgi:signal transduction histidine kinase